MIINSVFFWVFDSRLEGKILKRINSSREVVEVMHMRFLLLVAMALRILEQEAVVMETAVEESSNGLLEVVEMHK
jgi:hypothetical protein